MNNWRREAEWSLLICAHVDCMDSGQYSLYGGPLGPAIALSVHCMLCVVWRVCGVLCVLYVWCGGGGGGPEADILPTSESRSAPSQWWTGHPPAGGPGASCSL